MKSLSEYINERKQPNYTVEDFIKQFDKSQGGDIECLKIMIDIFENTPNKEKKKFGDVEDLSELKSFIYVETHGRGRDKGYSWQFVVKDEDNNKYWTITYTGDANITKIDWYRAHLWPTELNSRYPDSKLKFVEVEYSKELVELIHKYRKTAK